MKVNFTMKKILLLIILLCLFFSTTANAQHSWWSANANVKASSLQVTASVYNGLSRPIFCTGRVEGYTYYGQTLWSRFNAVIYPDNNAYAYVYTNHNNQFISAYANIRCRFY